MSFPLDRCHAAASLDARTNASEQTEVGIHIERGAKVGYPVANGYADFGNRSRLDAHARMARENSAANSEVIEQTEHGGTEPFEITANAQPESIQGKDRINGHLAGHMQYTAATPVYPTQRHAAGVTIFGVPADMGPTSAPANRDQRRMLANNK